jgi:hypothetical protein
MVKGVLRDECGNVFAAEEISEGEFGNFSGRGTYYWKENDHTYGGSIKNG